jgi:hypothetical protein
MGEGVGRDGPTKGNPMKHALIAASLVLVAATTAGCGDSGPPADASEKDFCASIDKFESNLGDMDADASTSDQIKAVKDAFADLEDTGTPKGIPDDARKGFELEVKTIADIDEDSSEKDLQNIDKDLSDDEQKQVDAFTEYVSDTCGDGDDSAN